jgi:hypothetical protein
MKGTGYLIAVVAALTFPVAYALAGDVIIALVAALIVSFLSWGPIAARRDRQRKNELAQGIYGRIDEIGGEPPIGPFFVYLRSFTSDAAKTESWQLTGPDGATYATQSGSPKVVLETLLERCWAARSSSWDIESRGCAHERRIDRVVIVGPPVLPPSIDEVYEEGIPVCAPLEMSDRYRFHSLRRPRLKLSDANDPRAGGQSKCSSRNPFHSNAPGLSILTSVNLRIVLVMAPITWGAVLFDLIRNEDAFRF